jgi:hypothetical protein
VTQSNLSYLDTFFGPAMPRYSGTDMNKRPTVEYVGAGVVVTDDTVNNRTVVTIAGVPTLGAGVATWLSTPSSANLLAAMTDETGTGSLVFGTAPTFKTSIILNNPANTFKYTISPGAIAADRIISFPAIVADDSFVFAAAGQTLTNKTIVAASNTITDTSATTGDILRHNGTRFVRLARGSANQVLAVNAGGTDIAWAAAGSASAAGNTGELQINAGAGVFGAATNVIGGSGFVSIGATPATVGGVRHASLGGAYFRNAGNTADVAIYETDASNNLFIGTPAAGRNSAKQPNATTVWGQSGVSLGAGTAFEQFFLDTTQILMGRPVLGYAGLSSPWGAVDGMAVVAVSTTNLTLTAAQYSRQVTQFTGAPVATRTITYPLPTTNDECYVKTVWCQTTVSGLTITNGGGLTVAIVANDAPHTLLFTQAGVIKLT